MPQKALITEADVRRAVQNGTFTLHVSGDPIITPLATSSLKDLGVRLVKDGEVIAGSEVTTCVKTAASPDTPIEIQGHDLKQLHEFYAMMWRARAFEQALGILFREKHLIGFLHLAIGQEAVPTGACAALNPDDYLTLTHRGHGQMVARGSDLNKMMAELLGRVTGYCRGKGGSIHLADFQNGILGANGIVGAGTVIATGAGMSAKMRGTSQVALAFFGDGAVNQGALHEAMNYASMQKLPVIYVCENNQYAVSMAAEKATSARFIAERGIAYNMPACQVDGQNVLAVYDTVKDAAEKARRGEGPSLIECLTYRYRGHWEGEVTDLRSKEERQLWQRRDPIERLGKAMISASIATQAQLDQIYEGIVKEIADAVRFAEQSPYPDPAEVTQHVLVKE
jgi:TPP-dependent pyruvate/acetoin dehydrogenase alpha subunit